MTYKDFNLFCEKIVYPYYEEIQRPDDECQYVNLRRWKMKFVYYRYESYRKRIRKLYMADEANSMDRHKIASNLMCAMLKVKPFKVDRLKANLPLHVLLANEYIAFYCALNIVELYKSDLLGERYRLEFPLTYIDARKQSYLENVCKALYYSKHFGLDDIFSYANVLFMLEKYTDTVLGIGGKVMKP